MSLPDINAQRPAILEGLHKTVNSMSQLGEKNFLFRNIVNEHCSLGYIFPGMLRSRVLQRESTYKRMRAAHQRC